VGVAVLIKNNGQTPAKNVAHWGEIQVAPIGQEWSMNAPTTLANVSRSVIVPGNTNSKFRWLNRGLSQQEKAGINNGNYAIFVYGRIEYEDIFGDRHWSTYRLRYSASAWPPRGETASMDFCDGGNDTD
jgi:hypothetical protein